MNRDPALRIGLALIAVLALLALFGPMLAAGDPDAVDLHARLLAPTAGGPVFGTDELGRSIALRLLVGLRWSLAVAGTATLVAATTGTALGIAAAGGHPLLRRGLRQAASFAQAFPVFVLAAVMIAILGNGFWTVSLTLGLITWPVFFRVVEAEAASLFTREYVLAARMMQLPAPALYARHILPGLVPSLSVLIAFHFADMLIAESALAFLGIGAPLGAATWGAMLSESRAYLLTGPWLLLAPAAAIVLVVIALNLVGDGLRRALA